MTTQRIASNIGAAPSIDLSVNLSHDDPILAVSISGELDMATAATLEGALHQYRGTNTPVSYDLTDLSFIDCAGLRALLKPADGDPFGGVISISSASQCVRRLFGILQLQSIIDTELCADLNDSPHLERDHPWRAPPI